MTTPAAAQEAVKTLLKVELKNKKNEELIELCLLYRAHPDLYPLFVNRLNEELGRRFGNAEQITAAPTEYSVLRHLANQFQSPLPLAIRRLQEMSDSVNREIWFKDNYAFFEEILRQEVVRQWLIATPEVLDKCLQVLRGRMALGNNLAMATLLLTNATAVALWKNTPNIMGIWSSCTPGMQVVAKSADLTRFALEQGKDSLLSNPPALSVLVNSETALPLLLDDLDLTERIFIREIDYVAKDILASAEFRQRLKTSKENSQRYLAKEAIFKRICNDADFLEFVIKEEALRETFIDLNNLFQKYKGDILNTVSNFANWTRQNYRGDHNQFGNWHTASKDKPGFIFATLGSNYDNNGNTNYGAYMNHQRANGSWVAAVGQTNSAYYPSALSPLNAIGFNGAKLESSVYWTGGSNYQRSGYAYVSVFTPPPKP